VPTGIFLLPEFGGVSFGKVFQEMRAMRTGMKTIIASMLALGVCVWVGEARADGDEISLGGGAASSDLASLSGGSLTIVDADATQNGSVVNPNVNNNGTMINGGNTAIANGTQGIVLQAQNSGNNSLIQQTAQINVYFAPQN